ncbi:MAG TPA: tetratricopeptide repeat protein [Pyrinomonadaceae bacterium]|jgi:tetratricopeptide (TPR) repeat protein|nr:tetratricopeptide repeat protein [Pyrinomonadaceae bacterium]
MKTFSRSLLARSLAILLATLFAVSPAWATCGGGGGGGGGGMTGGGGGGSAPETYPVPWKIRTPKDPPAKGLVVYWFPASADELKKSSLRMSRPLSLYAAQCISMELGDGQVPNAQKLVGEAKLPVAVIATPDGEPVTRVENTAGKLKVEALEKVLTSEVKTRESALDEQLKQAKVKADAGEKEAAIKLFQSVLEQKCMFPGKAKNAARELKKLGVNDVASLADGPEFGVPVFDAQRSARIELTMQRGLIAENGARYLAAEKLYQRARAMDPADPTPLRYLGELYRHHIGDWTKARTTFDAILNLPADPLSRAVALHGLGKITIHEGEFKKGLHLMEHAVAEYPLALAYRNLAVYWNSEGDLALGNDYTQKALALDPKDPYNLVFAAVFMAASGHPDEALKIARANVNLLPASYNLAAIYAQNGQRDEALAFLKRHFYQYERYQAVRSKEMMEARVDAVFDSLRNDSAFLALTRDADGRLMMRMKGMPATQASPNQ